MPAIRPELVKGGHALGAMSRYWNGQEADEPQMTVFSAFMTLVISSRRFKEVEINFAPNGKSPVASPPGCGRSGKRYFRG